MHQIKIVCCYSREDSALLDKFKQHLSSLQKNDSIDIWYDNHITAGTNWEQAIKENLDEAQIILLLISPSFIHSEYCFHTELQLAVERHNLRKAKVIPIILRKANWREIPFGNIKLSALQALPKDGQPITKWQDADEAWTEVVNEINRVIQEMRKPSGPSSEIAPLPTHPVTTPPPTDSATPPPTDLAPTPPKRDTSRRLLIAGLATVGLATLGGLIWWSPSLLAPCKPSRSAEAPLTSGLMTPDVLSWGADPYDNPAPYVFRDDNDNLIGFEVDIAEAIAKFMGINQQCYRTHYQYDIENDLQNDKIDIILNGWEITDKRLQNEKFSAAYYRTTQQLVVRMGDNRFKDYTTSSDLNLKELKPHNYRFGTGALYKAAYYLDNADIHPHTSENPLDDLDKKIVDIILIDTPIVAYYVEGKRKKEKAAPSTTLRPIGKPLFPKNDYVIGFKKDNPKVKALQHDIDQALQAMKQDGTLKNIYDEWGLWNEFQEGIGVKDCTAIHILARNLP